MPLDEDGYAKEMTAADLIAELSKLDPATMLDRNYLSPTYPVLLDRDGREENN